MRRDSQKLVKKYFVSYTSRGEKDPMMHNIEGYFMSDYPKTGQQLVDEAQQQVMNSKHAAKGETYLTLLKCITEITVKP